jgi:hypothetical protein
MKQSPSWENIKASASQEIPRIVSCSWQTATIIYIESDGYSSQHNSPSCFFKIHFNNTLPLTPRLSKRLFSCRFSKVNPLCTCPPSSTCNILRLLHPSWTKRSKFSALKVNPSRNGWYSRVRVACFFHGRKLLSHPSNTYIDHHLDSQIQALKGTSYRRIQLLKWTQNAGGLW